MRKTKITENQAFNRAKAEYINAMDSFAKGECAPYIFYTLGLAGAYADIWENTTGEVFRDKYKGAEFINSCIFEAYAKGVIK